MTPIILLSIGLAIVATCLIYSFKTLEIKIDKQQEIVANLAITNVEEVKKLREEISSIKEREQTDVVEDQLKAAREKVFTEWIQSIANYDPYNGGK